MKRAVLLAAVLALVGAAPARAGWKLDRATAIANIVWHQPCGGHVEVRWALPTTPLERDSAAWEMDCDVTLRADEPLSWGLFCWDVIHEFGHAAGFRDPSNTADPAHSANPRSVMYAGDHPELPDVEVERNARGLGTYEDDTDPRCALRGRPYLERHGVDLSGGHEHVEAGE